MKRQQAILLFLCIAIAGSALFLFLHFHDLRTAQQAVADSGAKSKSGAPLVVQSAPPTRIWEQRAISPGGAVIPRSVDKLAELSSPPVRQWLVQWKVNGDSAMALADLCDRVTKENAGPFETVELIRAIGFVDGTKDIGPLIDLALEQAKTALSQFTPPDPAAKSLVDAIWPLHALLWDTENWGITKDRKRDEQLLELVRPWFVRGSARSQAASYDYAENLTMQKRFAEAYDAYLQVVEERKIATAPSEGVNRGVEWDLGCCLFNLQRYAEAAPYLLEAARNTGFADGSQGWPLGATALARSGQVDLADKTLDEWIAARKPSVMEVAPVLREIEMARSGGKKPTDLPYLLPSSSLEKDSLDQKIARVHSQFDSNPRNGATQVFKDKPFDAIISEGAPDVAADLALRCINAQPDRIERLEYFLTARTKALLAAKKYPQALASARSLYNCASMPTTVKAVNLLAQCLKAAYPNDPAKSRQFLIEQLESADELAAGQQPIVKQIEIDASIYAKTDGGGLGEGNMLLICNEPEKARAVFEQLKATGDAPTAAQAATGIARAIKAQTGLIVPANDYLKTLQP